MGEEITRDDESPDPGAPAESGAEPTPSAPAAQAWSVLKLIATLALMLALAWAVVSVMQVIMSALGFTMG